MKRNVSVQLLRIISTIMIIVCHLTQCFSNKYIIMTGQFFNVGVYIFLIISGFLYANKKISEPIKWFFSRMKKLLIPVYIFLIYIFISNYFVNGVFNYKYIFYYLFNIQGFFDGINGAGHLWFLTSIMICYILLPFVKKIKINKIYSFYLTLLIITIIVSLFFPKIGQQLFYIMAFYLGYLINKKPLKLFNNYLVLVIITFIAIVIRIVGKIYFDETILYNVIISSVVHIIISMLMFNLFVNHNFNTNSFINQFDALSYYIYIVHYTFIVGPLKLMSISEYLIVNIIIMLIITIICSVVLKTISDAIMERKIKV